MPGDKWRADSPVGEAVAAISALTPDQLRDCSIEVRFAGDDAAPWVEVFSPRDNPVPLISFELPADKATADLGRLETLAVLHRLADLPRVRYAG